VEEIRVTFRRLLIPTILAFAPAVAHAQITTYVPVPVQSDSAKAAVVATRAAQADSSTKATLTNMKTWVDSAAGIAAAPDTAVTTVATNTTTTSTSPATGRPVTTTFSNGAVAPETASTLPLIALVGLAALSLGTVMLAGRGRA
jgi:hypothetical protein